MAKKTTESAAPKAKKATTKKAAAKKASPKAKKAAPKKAAAKKSSAPKAKKTTTKKAAPKVTAKQRDTLVKVQGAGSTGYFAEKKTEENSLKALVEKKLLKKGPKDKEKKASPYVLSKTGEKVLASPPPAS